MHDDTASRFTLSASRHSNYECELSLNSSCERLRSYCRTCTCFVVVKRHRAVTRIACRLQSAPNGCGNAPYPASLAGCGAIATMQLLASHARQRCTSQLRQAPHCGGIIRTQRAAQHAQSQPCRCAINTHARAKSPGAIAELRHLPCAACDRCGLRHAFRSGQPMHLLQRAAGIVAAMDAARGLQFSVDVIGDAWQDRADGAQKNGGRSNRYDHRDRPSRAAYLVARRAYLLRIDICGLSLPSLPGCTVKKYSGFHHAPAAHQVQPSHTSLFFSM